LYAVRREQTDELFYRARGVPDREDDERCHFVRTSLHGHADPMGIQP
jgi:hypothetical protein